MPTPVATRRPMRLFPWLALLSFMLLSGAACARQGVTPVEANQAFSDPRVAELADAAASGDAARVGALAQSGVPLDARGDKDVTLLQWALLARSERGMAALLDAGADPAQPGIDGDTAIHTAAMANDARYLKLLLAHGADANARNSVTGATPLASALRGGRAEQFTDLLAAGADPGLADRGGNTPLHQAAKYNDARHVLALLEAGANPTAENVQGVTFQRFLFQTREDVLNAETRRARKAVRDWLEAHDIPVQDPASR